MELASHSSISCWVLVSASFMAGAGWTSLIQGKVKSYGDALSKPVAGYGNCSPVRCDYGLSDGQSQTSAAYPTTARLAGTVAAVEDVGQVCGVDADSVIADRDSHLLVAF